MVDAHDDDCTHVTMTTYSNFVVESKMMVIVLCISFDL